MEEAGREDTRKDIRKESATRWGLTSAELAVWLLLAGAMPAALFFGRRRASREAAGKTDVADTTAVRFERRTGLESESYAVSPYRLDLNKATAAELELLPGIGKVRARRIIELREKLGDFRSLDELTAVRGVTRAMLKRLTSLVRPGFAPAEKARAETTPAWDN